MEKLLDLLLRQRPIPDTHLREAALKEAIQVAGSQPQRRVAGCWMDLFSMSLTTVGGWTVILVAPDILAIAIDRRLTAIRQGSNLNPLPCAYRLLNITTLAQAALKIEKVKTDSVRSWRLFTVGIAVHSPGPFVLVFFAFSHPIHISRTFCMGKLQRVWLEP